MDRFVQDFARVNGDRYNDAIEVRRYQNFEAVHVGDPIGCDHYPGLWGFARNGRWFKLNAFPRAIPANFAITPDHIEGRYLAAHFGRCETEMFVERLLRYAQQKGGWVDFTPEDIHLRVDDLDYFVEEYCFLVKKDGKYGYTMGFVFELYAAGPVIPANDPGEQEIQQKRDMFNGYISKQTVVSISLSGNQSIVGLYLRHDRQSVAISRDGKELQFAFTDIENAKKL